MRTLIRTASRFLLAGIFIYSGYGMFNHTERYAKQAAAALPMLPENPMLPKVLGATMMGAGSTLALGILQKTSARLLALALRRADVFCRMPRANVDPAPIIVAPSTFGSIGFS